MSAALPFAARRDECEIDADPRKDALLCVVDALHRDVRRLLDRDDRHDARLELLLSAIFDAAGDAAWNCADLAGLAALPGRDALAAAPAPYLQGRGLRSLGKALARAAGGDVGRYRLERIGADRGGALWLVRRVCRDQTRAGNCADTSTAARIGALPRMRITP